MKSRAARRAPAVTALTAGALQTQAVIEALALARLLSPSAWRSCAELAAALGIPEAGLQSRTLGLQALGVAVREERGALALSAPLQLLDPRRLQSSLASSGLTLRLLDACDSTNTVLAEMAAHSASGTVLACEYQTAGRGRRGRPWLSSLAGALTFSLLWRFDRPAAALSALPLVVAVALAEGLESVSGAALEVKWPNDLLYEQGKLAGILIEAEAHRSAAGGDRHGSTAIIGIGVNLHLSPSFSAGMDRPVTDLASAAAQPLPARTDVLAAVLIRLGAALAEFEQHGFAVFRERWLQRHAHQNRPVTLTLDGRLLCQGEAVGIADNGALLVRNAQGLQTVHSGEVSLR